MRKSILSSGIEVRWNAAHRKNTMCNVDVVYLKFDSLTGYIPISCAYDREYIFSDKMLIFSY